MIRARPTRAFTAKLLAIAGAVGGTSGATQPAPAPVQYQALAVPQPATTQADNLVSNILHDKQTIQTELAKVDMQARQVQLRSVARGRAYVRLTRAGLLPASAGVESLIEHAANVERLRRALDRDVQMQDELRDRKAKLLKKNAELDERLEAMQAERQLMETNRVTLEAARDRALAFERAFAGGEVPAHTAVYGAGVGPSEPIPVTSGFAALKGRLPFPLTGRTEVRPAKRRAASGPALEMLGPPGSVVAAVYPGTVAFADEYADYGKSIIVDHGDGYFTVSANLASIDVKVGEDVGSGGRLATISSDPARAALYFEIRRGTDTLDPAEWFGL